MRARLFRARTAAVVLALLGTGLWIPTWAGATPVVYGFTSGTLDITGTVGATTIFSETGIPLTGTSLTFDAAGPTIDDFSITGGPSALIAISPAYGGLDGFTLDSFTLSPGVGYSNLSVTGGPTSFLFTVGPTEAVGTATGYVGATPVMAIPFSETSATISGSLDLGTGTLTMTGITLLVITGVPGEAIPLIVKGDIVFTGMVPEPATAAMLAVGLGLALRRQRTHT